MATALPAIIGLMGTAVSVKGQFDAARAADDAAKAAEAQGRYNAQVAVNNMVAKQNDLAYQQSALALGKKVDMQQTEAKRKALRQKTKDELGKVSSRPSFGGSYTDLFKAAENEANTKLAEFDFEASQKTYNAFKQYQDTGRQMGLAYSLGMADRDLTIASANNQAYQYRMQGYQQRIGAVATGLAGFGQFGADTNNFKDLKF